MSESMQAAGVINVDSVGPGMADDKFADAITVYTGVVPFTFTLQIFLEEVKVQGVATWYITVHLTGFGTRQIIFVSDTVPVTLNTLTTVPFPAMAPPAVGSHQYDMTSVANSGYTNSQADAAPTHAFAIKVRVNSPAGSGVVPTVQVDDTSLNASWFIGARDIVITDPPIKFSKK